MHVLQALGLFYRRETVDVAAGTKAECCAVRRTVRRSELVRAVARHSVCGSRVALLRRPIFRRELGGEPATEPSLVKRTGTVFDD